MAPQYPRTAVGIDEQGRHLWLIVVDGKQPRYSEGIDLEELAEIMVQLGAHTGIELDGGGSATMAVARDTGAKVSVVQATPIYPLGSDR